MKLLKRILPILLLAGLLLFANSYSRKAVKVYDEGVALGISGDFVAAKTKFTVSQKLDPSYAPIKGALAMIADVETAKIDEKVAQLLFEGFELSHQGKDHMALQKMNQAVELAPSYAVAYLNRGGMRLKMGNYDSAILNFSQAITLDPDYTAAYYNRGLIYINYTDKLSLGCQDWKTACESGMCADYRQLQADGHCP